jgi:hypothetical protein
MQTQIVNSHGSHALDMFYKSYMPTDKRTFIVAWAEMSDCCIIYQRRYQAASPQEAMILMLKEEVSSDLFLVRDFYTMDEIVSTAYELGYLISVIAV